MAARRTISPRAVESAQPVRVADPTTDRALTALYDAVRRLESERQRFAVVADLAPGQNRVQHSLGRALVGVQVTPTVADAAFAWALDLNNPRPDLEVWINVIGVAQPGATVEVF